MRTRFLWFHAALLFGCLAALPCRATDECADDVVAVKFLGTVDCYWYPDAQKVLIKTLETDRREKVRYAAVMAITQQLQRGKAPLDATSGWRKVPDPEILTQICRIASFQEPLSQKELYQRYKDRQTAEFICKNQNQGNACHDCCSADVIAALIRASSEKDIIGCWKEPSDRIRWRAESALSLCCDSVAAKEYINSTPSQPSGTDGIPPMITQSPGADPFSQGDVQSSRSGFSGGGFRDQAGPPGLGRADSANRFNIFDNMSATPRSRVWFGYQFVESQNNAVFLTPNANKLFANLNTEAGRAQFISLTGYGRQPNRPAVNPHDPGSKEELKRLFLNANGGRSQNFLATPNSDLYRFGFEYAATTDFSISMMGQYVKPLNEHEQPDSFSNPSIQLKHVLYRSEDDLISGVFNIQPQIPRPQFGVGEDTTRLSPGLLQYRRLSEELFMQNAVDFSFPTEAHQITTFDFALGGGYWLYKDESLEPWYRGAKSENFIQALIPQFEVLGKTIIGDNAMPGQFDLSSNQAKTAVGTVSPVDGSRNIYFPQDFGLYRQSGFIYREPRTVVDLTFGMSVILKNNFVQSSALSIPITGGNARQVEFIMTLNKYF